MECGQAGLGPLERSLHPRPAITTSFAGASAFASSRPMPGPPPVIRIFRWSSRTSLPPGDEERAGVGTPKRPAHGWVAAAIRGRESLRGSPGEDRERERRGKRH